MTGPADDDAGLLERIREVVPLIAERAAEAEAQRKPADDVIDALKRTGVFRSFVPKEYGGYEIDLELFVDIGVSVSEACPSTGWITTFYMEHNLLLGLFDDELRREIFTAQPFILAPGTVIVEPWLKRSVALLRMFPAMLPVGAPPSPSCSVPALMVVPPV